jgi:PadR family transcriptional regulator, regulatory protein PadR
MTAIPSDAEHGGALPWLPRLPKNLMTPWILLLLKQWSAHGYLLLSQLQATGFPGIDHATLYRELRNMEAAGLISSTWATESSGPAKRIYQITAAGEEMLRGWVDVIASYQKMVGGFFELYAELFKASIPAMPGSESNTTNTEEKPND